MIDINKMRRLALDGDLAAMQEIILRLEAAESECLEQARLNGMGGEREAALMAKLEAAEKDIAIKEEVIDSLAAVVKRLDAQCDAAEAEAIEQARLNGMGSEREAALLSKLEAAEKERDDFAQQLVQSEVGKREISEAHDALQVEVGKLKDLEVSRCVKINGYIVDNARLAEEVVRLQAKIARMEQQVPVAEWIENRFHKYPQLVWNEKYRVNIGDKLYTLPGAKGE